MRRYRNHTQPFRDRKIRKQAAAYLMEPAEKYQRIAQSYFLADDEARQTSRRFDIYHFSPHH